MTTRDYSLADAVAPIIDAVSIQSPETVTFRNEAPIDVHRPGRYSTRGKLSENPLTDVLGQILYLRCYTVSVNGADHKGNESSPGLDITNEAFRQQLDQITERRPRWDRGWTVLEVLPNGYVSVRKGSRIRFTAPGSYFAPDRPGILPRKEDHVVLHVPVSSSRAMDGFYFLYGDELGSSRDEFSDVRFYFNVDWTGVAPFSAALVERLDRFRVPFHYKCLIDPRDYDRRDAAVLYVGRRWFSIAAQLIDDLGDDLLSRLDPEVPEFVLRFRPGVGIAETPNLNESFGEHRCRLIAEALVEAFKEGLLEPNERLQVVLDRFHSEGLALESPWLNPGSSPFTDLLPDFPSFT